MRFVATEGQGGGLTVCTAGGRQERVTTGMVCGGAVRLLSTVVGVLREKDAPAFVTSICSADGWSEPAADFAHNHHDFFRNSCEVHCYPVSCDDCTRLVLVDHSIDRRVAT